MDSSTQPASTGAAKEKKPVQAWSYTLRNPEGGWLGQIVLTSDGMFAGVTDWGNMAYAWRAFGEQDFRDFLLKLGADYFSSKLVNGAGYAFGHTRKIDAACDRFTMMILPALKEAIIAERAALKAATGGENGR